MPFINQSSFAGNRIIKGKHLETIVPALFRKMEIPYKRERLELADGDFLDIDWLCSNNNNLLVLFHGLEGSSNSQYIKGMSNHFNKLGWDICAVNFRSCSGEMNRLPRCYHSGATADVNEVFNHILTTKNYQTITAGGFSLGGNVLLKYLGEQKFKLPSSLKAAFSFSVPVDLAASSNEMAKFQNTLYMQRFLKTLIQKMVYKAQQFPGIMNTSGIDKIKTFTEFDDQFTAPLNGFKDAADYYLQSNSLQFLPNISIPTLLVNALNDPFLTHSCFPTFIADKHPYLFLETPNYGGHVGFAEGFPNQSYWSELRAHAFISALCN